MIEHAIWNLVISDSCVLLYFQSSWGSRFSLFLSVGHVDNKTKRRMREMEEETTCRNRENESEKEKHASVLSSLLLTQILFLFVLLLTALPFIDSGPFDFFPSWYPCDETIVPSTCWVHTKCFSYPHPIWRICVEQLLSSQCYWERLFFRNQHWRKTLYSICSLFTSEHQEIS